MKKRTRLIFTLVLITTFISCMSKHNIKQGENLNRFRYVVIAPLINADGSIDKYGVAARLVNLLIEEGLIVLSNDQAQTLPLYEKGQLLYIAIRHQSSSGVSNVWLDYFDAFNAKVYWGHGKYGMALALQDNLNHALDYAFKGFAENYIAFNPKKAKDPAKEIQARYRNWETLDLDQNLMRAYFDQNMENLDQIEGIWTEAENKQYKIGILRDEKSKNRDFVAIIVESNSPHWIPKQVKIELEKTVYPNAYSSNFYMENHSKQGTTARITEEGFLEFNLKNPDGTRFNAFYIKNYPMNLGGANRGSVSKSSPGSPVAGSGFLLDESGYVITNYHVVKGKNEINVKIPQLNRTLSASIVLKDNNNDIAVLRLSNFDFMKLYSGRIPYSISSSKSISLGQRVFTLGYPLSDLLGSSVKFSTGEISSLYGIQDDPRVYQISNPIQPGNSGGPLFNENGELVGIVVASINAKYLFEKIDVMPQNVNFAIKSDYLINLISMLPEGDKILARKSSISKGNAEVKVDRLTPFVVRIVAK